MMVDADLDLLSGRLQGLQLITVLAGGVGAARLLAGLVRVVPRRDLTAIVNVGDDVELHGLHISPDLDTVTYTLAGAIDPERGWGLAGETWQAMEALRRYPLARAWFNLGDRDLATHLYRTDRLRAGATLSEVTAEIAAAWELGLRLLPASPTTRCARVVDRGRTARSTSRSTSCSASTTSPSTARALRRRRDGAARARRARRHRDGGRVRHRAVEPDRLDRPGARRAGRARGRRGPARGRGGRVADHRRRRAQGSGRPPAAASSATSRPSSAWPASTPRWRPRS